MDNQGEIEKFKYIFGNICLKLMFVFLALIPFGFTFYKVSKSLFSMYYEALQITMISIIILVGICTFSAAIPNSISKNQRSCIIISMFCFSLIIRTLVIQILQTTPISDFKHCYDYAASQLGDAETEFIAKFPYLGAYAVLLKGVFTFLPKNVFSAQLVNAVATSFIPVFLFLGTEKMTSKIKIALIAGLTYAFYPGLIIYNAVTSCEHISQLFFSIGFYALACEKTVSAKPNKVAAFICGAVAFGLMCLFKELFIIVAPALLMMGFCYDTLPCIVKKIKNHLPSAGIIRSIAKNVLYVMIIFGVYKCSAMAVQFEIAGKTIDRNDPVSVPIYRGLALEGRGAWNAEVNAICDQVRAEYSSNKEVNRVLFNKLISEYDGDVGLLIDVVSSKLETDFCNEGVYWYWTFNEDGNNILQRTWTGEVYFAFFPSAFFMAMCFVMMIGLIFRTLKKSKREEVEFFITGVVFLLTVLLMLMETQGRYKSNIMPYICVLFALSVDIIFEITRMFKLKILDRLKKKI